MGQVGILAITSLKREESPQANSRRTVKLKSNSGTENLKREAVGKERGSRSERIRYRQIEPGGITKLRGAAEQKVTWSKKSRTSGGDTQSRDEGYPIQREGR